MTHDELRGKVRAILVQAEHPTLRGRGRSRGCPKCAALADDILALFEPLVGALDERRWRRALWIRHGCPIFALYGDDGEMQCSTCRLDFKRDSLEVIERRWYEDACAALATERRA